MWLSAGKRGQRGSHALRTAGCSVGPIMVIGAYLNSVPVRGNVLSSGVGVPEAPYTTKPGTKWTGIAAHMPEPVSQVLRQVGNVVEQEPTAEDAEQTSDKITTSYARVEVVQPGEAGMTWLERESGQPRIDRMTQHMRGLLGFRAVAMLRQSVGACR